MLPEALIMPVTYSPVVANVATPVPATPTVTLPLAAATTFDVPFTIELGVPPPPDIPVSNEPLPTKKLPEIFAVVVTLPCSAAKLPVYVGKYVATLALL